MYLGQDLGETRAVIGVSYHHIAGSGSIRMHGKFQVANRRDFSDATTVHTVDGEVEYGYHHVDLAAPVFGRYVRFCHDDISPDCITPAEVEFCSSPVSAAHGGDFADTGSIVAWESDDTDVYRSYSPEGPWTKIATVEQGVKTFTDTDVVYGAVAYYKVGSDVCAFTRMRRLERKNASTFADGVSIIMTGSYYGGSPDVSTMFDGNVGTCPDIVTNPNVGLDFGRRVYIAQVRVYPRQISDATIFGRTDGVVAYATDGDWGSDYSRPLSCQLVYGDYDAFRWSVLSCDSSVPYRYAYLHNDMADSYGNWAEVEYYGWNEDDLSSSAAAPQDVGLSLVSGLGVDVAWSCAGSPDSYLLQRRASGGEWSTVATLVAGSAGYEAKRFSDGGLVADTVYGYRVVAEYLVPLTASKASSEATILACEPVSLAISADLLGDGYPVVSWADAGVMAGPVAAKVYRSGSESGPWTVVGSVPAGVLSHTDRTVGFGSTVYYRIGPAEGANAGAISEVLPFLRVHRLERTSDGALAGGVSIIAQGSPYGGDPAGAPEKIFDGDLATSANLASPDNPRVGIDFGEGNAAYIVSMRIYPRQIHDDLIYNRTDGVQVYGTDGDWTASGTALSPALNYGTHDGFRWSTLECDHSAAYRYVFVQNTRINSYANWSEIEFYGWTAADLSTSGGGLVILIR